MAKRDKPTKARKKTWLKAHGHGNKAVNDALDPNGVSSELAGICALHGVTVANVLAKLSGGA